MTPVERSIQGVGASGRKPAGDFERAAVIGERPKARRAGPPRYHVAFAIRCRSRSRSDRRGADRLSGASLSRDWPSRHLDGPLARVAGGGGSIGRSSSFAARRALGVVALCLYLAPVALIAWAATRALVSRGALGFAALALLAASLPAQRSLAIHVRAVAEGLDASLEEGRRAVAKIVGRNPEALDEAGVARAAIESLAENFSDGVVAPILWIALGGLIGGALYKAINTADSMIGHKDDRYAAFGWAAARLDDLVNLPASRLAALWLILAAALTPGASARRRRAGRMARRFAHRSPNAGWPEAAMAGALGLKLAGPRVYGETLRRGRVHGARPVRGGRRRHPAGAAALYRRVACADSGARLARARRSSREREIASRSRCASQWSASASSVRSIVAS